VACVVLQGEGGKAFCAGGDVKSLYLAKTAPSDKNPPSILQKFFATEYVLDYKLANMSPVLVALMDGIVMGGGVGISVHAPVRIATENSLFAMPEAKLGLFTDVGGGYFLSRLSNNLGMFLGLTGYRLKGADLFHAGVADYYVNRENLASLKQDII
jgi:enoyl-CoA hydratase/carnithine racemase